MVKQPLIESILIYGLMASGTLALLALGFTLIFGVAGLVNMAHGAIYMTGTYIFWILTSPVITELTIQVSPIKLSLPLALIIAVIISAIIGTAIYRLIIHPILEDLIAVLIVTVGLAIIIQEVISMQFSTVNRSVLYLLPGLIKIWGVSVTYSSILSFVVSLIVFAGLVMFIRETKIGTAMRAVAQDREVAMLMGVNNETVYMLTMGIASALAAIAGILTTASGFANPFMWSTPLYMAFSIVILGGIGSLKGTLVGAFIIGYAGQIFTSIAPSVGILSNAVVLAILVVVLLFRPKGLFGRRIEMEE
jgi:branched-chain amino acid transport system permease protein